MNITILLRHSGIWVSNVNYEGYKVDGTVVGESISFMNLKALILAELEIGGVRKDIKIRYIVDENTCPLKIRNDMGVKLYLEVRRNEPGIGIDECGWTLISSCKKKFDVFKVRYFNNEHMCPMRDRILTKVQATVEFISGVTAPKLFNHKRIHTPQDVIEDIRAIYGNEISYQQTWRAKERALEMLKGKPSEGYEQMPRYIWMLNNMYPNSYIRMQKTENNQFMYLFITLRPLIRGFDYCRPVVVVDVAHLGGAYK
ncbi:hypothetical protein H5410_049236, partial [Solanum commersonii]